MLCHFTDLTATVLTSTVLYTYNLIASTEPPADVKTPHHAHRLA
jgi:hypothetical protein